MDFFLMALGLGLFFFLLLAGVALVFWVLDRILR